jgi:hypothetical protein
LIWTKHSLHIGWSQHRVWFRYGGKVKKQMGHSVAFLYRNTSRGCPLTKGSCGRLISRGMSSVVEPFRDPPPPKTAAMAFPRGLKGEFALGAWAETGDGSAEPGLDEACSEAVDGERPVIGIVRLSRFEEPSVRGFAGSGRGMRSSGGIWSAGGTGNPRAAAMICGSVHWSSKSFKPRQKGATFRSI